VPTDIVEGIQRPLADYLRGSTKRRRQTEMFAEFLALRHGDGVLLLGLIGAGIDRSEASQAFTHILDGFRSRAGLSIAAQSGAVTAEDLPLALWLDADKLDLDQLTWSGKAGADAAAPHR
jgi:hypothetical protein